MIYEPVDPGAPIRQGDIFHSIPRVEVPLENLPVVYDDEDRNQTWTEAR